MPTKRDGPDEERMQFLLTLRRRGIGDQAVLRALDEVPRQNFVTDQFAGLAYADQALPIDCGQTISQPYIVALMTEKLKVKRGDKVLEVHRTSDGFMEEFPIETSNLFMYPPFVTESVDRFVKGQPPLANLDDLVEVMKVVDAAFASSRAGSKITALSGKS